MSSTYTQAHLPIAEDYPNELRIHVAFVLNLEDDNAYHVFEVADITGLFIFPVPAEKLSGLLKCAVDLARSTPRRAGEEKYRDLNEFIQPFVRAFEGGVAFAKMQQDAVVDEEEFSLGKPKEKAIALGDGKKGMLQWVSKKATLIVHEHKARKAARKVTSDTASGATTLVEATTTRSGKVTSDASSIKTTRTMSSFFTKDGDWCKTKKSKKSAHSFFFFSSKKSSRPKATAADIRAEYLARGPTATTSRDPASLSVPVEARHSVVSGPDWSRKDLWDDETVEALFMNERFAQNNILGGPMFE